MEGLKGIVQLFLILEWSATVVGFLVGVEALLLPNRAIRRYQGIMRRFNWEVAPIHQPLEVRNTRLLGCLLVVLTSTLAIRLL